MKGSICPRSGNYIRTLKERVCTAVNTLPFEKFPHQLIVETVYNAVYWSN